MLGAALRPDTDGIGNALQRRQRRESGQIAGFRVVRRRDVLGPRGQTSEIPLNLDLVDVLLGSRVHHHTDGRSVGPKAGQAQGGRYVNAGGEFFDGLPGRSLEQDVRVIQFVPDRSPAA